MVYMSSLISKANRLIHLRLWLSCHFPFLFLIVFFFCCDDNQRLFQCGGVFTQELRLKNNLLQSNTLESENIIPPFFVSAFWRIKKTWRLHTDIDPITVWQEVRLRGRKCKENHCVFFTHEWRFRFFAHILSIFYETCLLTTLVNSKYL